MNERLIWHEGMKPYCCRCFPFDSPLVNRTVPAEARAGLHVFSCTAGHGITYHDYEEPKEDPGVLCLRCAKPLKTDGHPIPKHYHALCRPKANSHPMFTTCAHCNKPKAPSQGQYHDACRKIRQRAQFDHMHARRQTSLVSVP